MSFDTLRRSRSIEIIPITRDDIDDYGNEVETEGTPVPTEARRDQLSSTEDVVDRDQQARTFRYFLKPTVVVNGRDLIRDDGQLHKIIGEPEVISNQLGPHHIEVLTELTDG